MQEANVTSRADAVRRYEILDTPRDGAFDRIAAVAASLFQVPIATVTIVDGSRVWFLALEGLEGVTEIGNEPGLCASVVLQDDPYVVNDAIADPRTLDHPLVRGDLGLRFYAAAPIITADGCRLGTVNVIGKEPREVTDEETAALANLAAIVMEQLELRLQAINAVRAERELRRRAEHERDVAHRLTHSVQTAAEAARAQGDAPAHCEVRDVGGASCERPAELRIADSWGDAAWSCPAHAEEALVSAPGVFLASPEGRAGSGSWRTASGSPV